jgi:hypothetical protein
MNTVYLVYILRFYNRAKRLIPRYVFELDNYLSMNITADITMEFIIYRIVLE